MLRKRWKMVEAEQSVARCCVTNRPTSWPKYHQTIPDVNVMNMMNVQTCHCCKKSYTPGYQVTHVMGHGSTWFCTLCASIRGSTSYRWGFRVAYVHGLFVANWCDKSCKSWTALLILEKHLKKKPGGSSSFHSVESINTSALKSSVLFFASGKHRLIFVYAFLFVFGFFPSFLLKTKNHNVFRLCFTDSCDDSNNVQSSWFSTQSWCARSSWSTVLFKFSCWNVYHNILTKET